MWAKVRATGRGEYILPPNSEDELLVNEAAIVSILDSSQGLFHAHDGDMGRRNELKNMAENPKLIAVAVPTDRPALVGGLGAWLGRSGPKFAPKTE